MNGLFPASLDREMVIAMKAAGFKTLNLSLGTTSGAQLKRFRRPNTLSAFENALELAESCGLNAVGYIIVAAPFQNPMDSVDDLLYLASLRTLAGVSVFYPSPGSVDYDLCIQLGILPDTSVPDAIQRPSFVSRHIPDRIHHADAAGKTSEFHEILNRPEN